MLFPEIGRVFNFEFHIFTVSAIHFCKFIHTINKVSAEPKEALDFLHLIIHNLQGDCDEKEYIKNIRNFVINFIFFLSSYAYCRIIS